MSIFTDILQIKKPEKCLVESLLSSYESLAKAKGFEVSKKGKTLFFKGEHISVLLWIEFGGRRDFFETISSMSSTPAEYKILVMSSNAKALPMEAVYTVLKKKLLVKERWMLIDIEGKKPPMCINWTFPMAVAAPREGRRRPAPKPVQGPLPEKQRKTDPFVEYAERQESRRSRHKRERRKMIYRARDERKEQD